MHLQQDPENQWFATNFQLVEEDIETYFQDYHEEWRQPIADDQLSIEIDPEKDGTLGNQGADHEGEEIP